MTEYRYICISISFRHRMVRVSSSWKRTTETNTYFDMLKFYQLEEHPFELPNFLFYILQKARKNTFSFIPAHTALHQLHTGHSLTKSINIRDISNTNKNDNTKYSKMKKMKKKKHFEKLIMIIPIKHYLPRHYWK